MEKDPEKKMSSRNELSEIRHFDLINNWLVAGGTDGILSVKHLCCVFVPFFLRIFKKTGLELGNQWASVFTPAFWDDNWVTLFIWGTGIYILISIFVFMHFWKVDSDIPCHQSIWLWSDNHKKDDISYRDRGETGKKEIFFWRNTLKNVKGCLVSDSRGDANILFRHQHQVRKQTWKVFFLQRWLVSLEWLGFFNGTTVGSASVYRRQGTLYHRRFSFMELHLIRIKLTSKGAWVS